MADRKVRRTKVAAAGGRKLAAKPTLSVAASKTSAVAPKPVASKPIAPAKLPIAAEPAVAPASAVPKPVIAANPIIAAKPVAAAKPVTAATPVVVAKPVAAQPVAVPKPVAAPVATRAVASPHAVPAVVRAAPATAVAAAKPPKINTTPKIDITLTPPTPKETTMNETITNAQNGAADAIKSGTAAAYSNGKAALEQVTAKSKETIESGMKQMDEMSAMTKGHVEALMASTKAATAGLEAIAHQVADYSRKSFEETTAVARAMTTVKTPNEFMQLQNDFAKSQFDAAVAEMSKLSETMVKLAGEVFEPMQNRMAVATDKLKSAVGTSFKV